MAGRRWKVGQARYRIWIDDAWRVLDVGSGHVPHPRADVLLEKFLDDDTERAGSPIDQSDPRLVIGDALSMPFEDGEFDFVIASHVAEHVDDPERFCRELSRVGRAGYIESPGWLGDRLLREPFHPWRVQKYRRGLRFDRVAAEQPSLLGEAVYGLVYFGEDRPGHRGYVARSRASRLAASAVRLGAAVVIRAPFLVDAMYTRHAWHGQLPCVVKP